MIDEAAGDRTKLGVIVFDDRWHERRRAARTLGPERMTPFHHAPAVVPTALDQEYLFPQILPHIAGPQIARGAIEAELPRLTQAIGPDLGSRPVLCGKRIVRRNRIRVAPFRFIDVDPQDRTRHVPDVLPSQQLIGDAARITGADIEVSIRAKLQAAAVVTAGRPFKNELLGIWIGLEPIAVANLKPRHARSPRSFRNGIDEIRDIEVAVRGESRMERQTIDRFFFAEV